ncbi:putative integral membrane protein-like protein [Collimonas arenae]|uniref:Putative integral membrane protein-like protein n=1 Tax=Collimonas arenae TaxID=279058 RepID=A0A127QK49_9BURK|nr:putative integral membrane protein-like protein [Collimonas arenae]AMP10441.1 putative integral membrane protein-like protein [Collimonas arenae]
MSSTGINAARAPNILSIEDNVYRLNITTGNTWLTIGAAIT